MNYCPVVTQSRLGELNYAAYKIRCQANSEWLELSLRLNFTYGELATFSPDFHELNYDEKQFVIRMLEFNQDPFLGEGAYAYALQWVAEFERFRWKTPYKPVDTYL